VLWTPRLVVPTAWYRADNGPSGSPISSWSEYPGGGGGTATQGTLANRPLAAAARSGAANKLASRFDGTDFLTSAADIDCSAGLTAITVMETRALKNFNGWLRIASHEINDVAGGICVYSVTTGAVAVRNCGASGSWYRTLPTGAVQANTVHILLLKFGGSFATLSVQMGTITAGVLSWATLTSTGDLGTAALPAASGNKLILGAGWTDPGGLNDGFLFEQIVLNRVITAGEETSFKTYAQREYAP